MSKRFDTMKFKNFSGGIGQKFLKEAGKYRQSYRVKYNLKTKKISLARKLLYGEFDGLGLNENRTGDVIEKKFLIAFQNNDAPAGVQVYKSESHGSYSSIHSFAVTTTDPMYSFSFLNLWCVLFKDPTDHAGKIRLGYTSDYGANFTEIDYPGGEVVDHVVSKTGNKIYLLDKDNKIYESSNGISYTLYFDGSASGLVIKKIEGFRDFLYAIVLGKDGARSGLARFENEELKFVYSFSSDSVSADLVNFGNDRLLVANVSAEEIDLYNYDGDTITKFGNLDNLDFIGVRFLISNNNKVFFAGATSLNGGILEYRHLFTINDKLGLFYEHSLLANYSYLAGFSHLGEDYLQALAFGSPNKFRIYQSSGHKFEADGYITTSIIDDGEISPRQFKLKHDPLSADTLIKAYIKKDKATSWGSSFLTSDTDNAISKTYSFPKGDKIDFAEFKIQLETTDDTVSPEEVEFEFIYKKIGLENAK